MGYSWATHFEMTMILGYSWATQKNYPVEGYFWATDFEKVEIGLLEEIFSFTQLLPGTKNMYALDNNINTNIVTLYR